MRTITHLYDTYDTAERVAQALEAAGFAHDHVSVVANHGALTGSALVAEPGMVPPDDTALERPLATSVGDSAGMGASVGTLLGGGAGLLAGIGAMAIPGVGPVVAAGWLVATLTGAGAGAGIGGLLGALTGSGVEAEHAQIYAEGVRRGGTLVTVRAEDALAAQAETIMLDYHPVDIAERGTAYRDNGWTGFDETRAGLTEEELRAERLRAERPAL